MTYRITRDGETHPEAVTHFDWWTLAAAADDVATEADAARLICDVDLLVLRRPA